MNKPSNMVKVAVDGGEGIGPEVTAQSHRILNGFAARRGVTAPIVAASQALAASAPLKTEVLKGADFVLTRGIPVPQFLARRGEVGVGLLQRALQRRQLALGAVGMGAVELAVAARRR